MTVPEHIGFIMDGNGRWATSRGLARTAGYAAGLLALRRVALRCDELGVKAITVYAFSTENNSRPEEEISAIEEVVKNFNLDYDGAFRISYMGDLYSLDDVLRRSMEIIEERTEGNTGLNLNIAFNYGGRADILHAAKVAYDHGEFIEDTFEKNLSSAHLPPLDLIVRTGGEKRLSNFMLYEAAYAELIFSDKLWPDVEPSDTDAFIAEFSARKRRFGGAQRD